LEIGPEDQEAGSDQSFSKSEMTIRKKQKSERRELGKDRWYTQMRQVQSWDKLEYVGQVGLGQGGLQIR